MNINGVVKSMLVPVHSAPTQNIKSIVVDKGTPSKASSLQVSGHTLPTNSVGSLIPTNNANIQVKPIPAVNRNHTKTIIVHQSQAKTIPMATSVQAQNKKVLIAPNVVTPVSQRVTNAGQWKHGQIPSSGIVRMLSSPVASAAAGPISLIKDNNLPTPVALRPQPKMFLQNKEGKLVPLPMGMVNMATPTVSSCGNVIVSPPPTIVGKQFVTGVNKQQILTLPPPLTPKPGQNIVVPNKTHNISKQFLIQVPGRNGSVKYAMPVSVVSQPKQPNVQCTSLPTMGNGQKTVLTSQATSPRYTALSTMGNSQRTVKELICSNQKIIPVKDLSTSTQYAHKPVSLMTTPANYQPVSLVTSTTGSQPVSILNSTVVSQTSTTNPINIVMPGGQCATVTDKTKPYLYYDFSKVYKRTPTPPPLDESPAKASSISLPNIAAQFGMPNITLVTPTTTMAIPVTSQTITSSTISNNKSVLNIPVVPLDSSNGHIGSHKTDLDTQNNDASEENGWSLKIDSVYSLTERENNPFSTSNSSSLKRKWLKDDDDTSDSGFGMVVDEAVAMDGVKHGKEDIKDYDVDCFSQNTDIVDQDESSCDTLVYELDTYALNTSDHIKGNSQSKVTDKCSKEADIVSSRSITPEDEQSLKSRSVSPLGDSRSETTTPDGLTESCSRRATTVVESKFVGRCASHVDAIDIPDKGATPVKDPGIDSRDGTSVTGLQFPCINRTCSPVENEKEVCKRNSSRSESISVDDGLSLDSLTQMKESSITSHHKDKRTMHQATISEKEKGKDNNVDQVTTGQAINDDTVLVQAAEDTIRELQILAKLQRSGGFSSTDSLMEEGKSSAGKDQMIEEPCDKVTKSPTPNKNVKMGNISNIPKSEAQRKIKGPKSDEELAIEKVMELVSLYDKTKTKEGEKTGEKNTVSNQEAIDTFMNRILQEVALSECVEKLKIDPVPPEVYKRKTIINISKPNLSIKPIPILPKEPMIAVHKQVRMVKARVLVRLQRQRRLKRQKMYGRCMKEPKWRKKFAHCFRSTVVLPKCDFPDGTVNVHDFKVPELPESLKAKYRTHNDKKVWMIKNALRKRNLPLDHSDIIPNAVVINPPKSHILVVPTSNGMSYYTMVNYGGTRGHNSVPGFRRISPAAPSTVISNTAPLSKKIFTVVKNPAVSQGGAPPAPIKMTINMAPSMGGASKKGGIVASAPKVPMGYRIVVPKSGVATAAQFASKFVVSQNASQPVGVSQSPMSSLGIGTSLLKPIVTGVTSGYPSKVTTMTAVKVDGKTYFSPLVNPPPATSTMLTLGKQGTSMASMISPALKSEMYGTIDNIPASNLASILKGPMNSASSNVSILTNPTAGASSASTISTVGLPTSSMISNGTTSKATSLYQSSFSGPLAAAKGNVATAAKTPITLVSGTTPTLAIQPKLPRSVAGSTAPNVSLTVPATSVTPASFSGDHNKSKMMVLKTNTGMFIVPVPPANMTGTLVPGTNGQNPLFVITPTSSAQPGQPTIIAHATGIKQAGSTASIVSPSGAAVSVMSPRVGAVSVMSPTMGVVGQSKSLATPSVGVVNQFRPPVQQTQLGMKSIFTNASPKEATIPRILAKASTITSTQLHPPTLTPIEISPLPRPIEITPMPTPIEITPIPTPIEIAPLPDSSFTPFAVTTPTLSYYNTNIPSDVTIKPEPTTSGYGDEEDCLPPPPKIVKTEVEQERHKKRIADLKAELKKQEEALEAIRKRRSKKPTFDSIDLL